MWVGLGGFAYNSRALEQIGTEIDCTRSGRSASSVWSEQIPASPRTLHLTVRPGDSVAATVVVSGHLVTFAFTNLTRHTSYRRTHYARFIDIGSAEWILEVPSVCADSGACKSLPLANFGTAQFSRARAQTTAGHMGTISDHAWHRSRVRLRPHDERFLVLRGRAARAGGANPSGLSTDGGSFTVTFAHVLVRFFGPLGRAVAAVKGSRGYSGRA